MLDSVTFQSIYRTICLKREKERERDRAKLVESKSGNGTHLHWCYPDVGLRPLCHNIEHIAWMERTSKSAASNDSCQLSLTVIRENTQENERVSLLCISAFIHTKIQILAFDSKFVSIYILKSKKLLCSFDTICSIYYCIRNEA